jgi:hypothetical protein
MPVKDIEVRLIPPRAGTEYRPRIASWYLPYLKTMVGTGEGYESYRCYPSGRTETEKYFEHRNLILNGLKNKVLFDCNRGLRGDFFDEHETDYRKVQVFPIRSGSLGEEYYEGVCKAVTGKNPYLPK